MGLAAAALTALAAGVLCALPRSVGHAGMQALLGEELGAAAPRAALDRTEPTGVRVHAGRRDFSAADRQIAVGLALAGAGGPWERHANGATRTSGGVTESVVFQPYGAEQFLTVPHRLGNRTWRWRLEGKGLTPHLHPTDGSVLLYRGTLRTGAFVLPLRILDRDGRDITPHGLRWGIRRDRSGWWLTLGLDDRRLPTPYVIDPGIAVRNVTVNSSTSATSLSINRPAGVLIGDIMVAFVATTSTSVTVSSSGWLAYNSITGTGIKGSFLWKQVVATDLSTGSYSFSIGSTARPIAGGIVAYQGVQCQGSNGNQACES